MSEKPVHDEPPVRPSTLTRRENFPGVRAREELNVLLRAHNPEVAEANLATLTEKHSELLRRIAREPATSSTGPSVRRNAITALGRLPSELNLAVLRELSTGDDDGAVRGNAMTALAGVGAESDIPALAAALESPHPVESVAARKALITLAVRLGVDVVERSLPPGQRLGGPAGTSRGESRPDSAG